MGERHYNKHMAAIIKKADGALIFVKIREGLTDEEACHIERAFISVIGRADREMGPLANRTDGGDGSFGYVHTESAKNRIAKAMTGRTVKPETREKLRRANLGKKNGHVHSHEFKQRIKALHLGRIKSPDECKKISSGKMGHTVSEKTRDKIRSKLVGKKLSAQHIARVSAGVKAARARQKQQRIALLVEALLSA